MSQLTNYVQSIDSNVKEFNGTINVEDGQIKNKNITPGLAVARVGEDVTVKRFEKNGQHVLLHAENEDFDPIKVDLAEEPFNIEGIAVGVIRNADWM